MDDEIIPVQTMLGNAFLYASFHAANGIASTIPFAYNMADSPANQSPYLLGWTILYYTKTRIMRLLLTRFANW